MSRLPVLPLIGAAACAAAMLAAYLFIKPALHIAIVSGAAILLFTSCLTPQLKRSVAPAAMTIGVGTPLLAWALPNIWLLHLAMVALVPLFARRLNQVAPIYLFALLLLPGLDDMVSLGSLKLCDFGVQDALAVGATAAVFLTRRGRGAARPDLDLPAIGVVLLIVAALARDTTVTNFIRVFCNAFLDLWLPYYVLSRSVRSADDVRACMVWLSCGGAVLSVVLMYEIWKAWPIYNELYAHYGVQTLLLVKARGGILRPGGPFVEPTSIAMVLTSCVLAVWLARSAFRSRHHHIAMLVLLLAGLCAPQSRGAWIGLLIGMALADLFRRRYSRLAWRIVPIAIGGVVLMALARVSPMVAETLGMTGTSSASGEYRKLLLDRGFEEFLHSPIWGYSVPQLWVRLHDLKQGENIIDFVNTYIWIMLISGGIGLAIFVGSFLFFLVRLWRQRGGKDADVAAFVFAGLAMPMEMLFFTSFGGRPAFFIFIFFGLASALIAARGRALSEKRPQDRVAQYPQRDAAHAYP